ncbi:MAG: FAD-dependent oxidoreductase [Clostridia bacterium]|nr:FAD-dependent oxidoreductase [Clostridia bacterium]
MKRLVSLLLTACMLCTAVSFAFAQSYTPGTYLGEGQGNNPEVPIRVEVTFTEDAISQIQIVGQEETPGISDPALDTLPAAILDAQSLAVDSVSGATNTSRGILEAVEQAVVAAGANPDDLRTAAPEETAEKTAVERETDVLVIGAGIAGYAAALSAKENGANVILIDKMAAVGGTTNLAGGILVCVDSELFKDNRLESDSLEAVTAYWRQHMSYSGVESGYPDWDRLTGVLADTGATVDWLVSNGIQFDSVPYAASSTYPMALANGGGAGLIQMLKASADEKGIELITECRATDLVQDENGRVTGAVAETKDSVITFKAGSVVLATGGISQNEELVQKYSSKLHTAGLIPTSAVSHTGDGFLMALAAGAGTFDVFSTPLFGTTFDPALQGADSLAIYGALGVNGNGDRFANEAASAGWDVMDYTASDMIQDGNAPFWYVYDSSDEAVAAVLEKGAQDGVVAKGDTAEDLARAMHVYTARFVSSVDAYNAACEAGEDTQFGKPAAFLQKLEKAPFYAVKVYPTTFGSAGGVTTTDRGEVTRQDGTVIEGLYAAGEMSNRYYYNENYILAASLALYSTMGRRAGAAAAAFVK